MGFAVDGEMQREMGVVEDGRPGVIVVVGWWVFDVDFEGPESCCAAILPSCGE